MGEKEKVETIGRKRSSNREVNNDEIGFTVGENVVVLLKVVLKGRKERKKEKKKKEREKFKKN